MVPILNPYRPGAGHTPLYLAGRSTEENTFQRLLAQQPVLTNLILSGLRGVGKTVLLEDLKPKARHSGWLWAGNEVSEAASVTEENLARRLITDLSVLLGPILMKTNHTQPFGFLREKEKHKIPVSFEDLWEIYTSTPGLTADKLKNVIARTCDMLRGTEIKGIVFAYDEAQILSDHAKDQEYPLSLLLDVFASLQRHHHEVQILLVLTGLPTLYPQLVKARTFVERMFDVLTLDKLSEEDSRLAIEKPLEISESTLVFSPGVVDLIIKMSGGYPYFIQYICKETFDAWMNKFTSGEITAVTENEILSKLYMIFFAPRWEQATERQQQFMQVISSLETANSEFTTREIVVESKAALEKGFSPSHATQMLTALIENGLVYRNRHGKYSFAVPMMADFIRRQTLLAKSS